MLSWVFSTHPTNLRQLRKTWHINTVITHQTEQPLMIWGMIQRYRKTIRPVNGTGSCSPSEVYTATPPQSRWSLQHLQGLEGAQNLTPKSCSRPRSIERILFLLGCLCLACCVWTVYNWVEQELDLYSNTRNDSLPWPWLLLFITQYLRGYHQDLPAGLIHKLRIDGVCHLKSFGTSHESQRNIESSTWAQLFCKDKNPNHGKGKSPLSLERLSGSGTVQSTVFLVASPFIYHLFTNLSARILLPSLVFLCSLSLSLRSRFLCINLIYVNNLLLVTI